MGLDHAGAQLPARGSAPRTEIRWSWMDLQTDQATHVHGGVEHIPGPGLPGSSWAFFVWFLHLNLVLIFLLVPMEEGRYRKHMALSMSLTAKGEKTSSLCLLSMRPIVASWRAIL